MRLARVIPVAALLAAAGCGGGKYVKVAGVVTLNGKPYKNAVVSFQPVGGKENPNPGPGSSAVTDENGRFELVAVDGTPGAAVGKHRVQIQTRRDDPTAYIDPELGSEDNPAPPKKPQVDPIPLEWYGDNSNKEFEVPPGGTDRANFEIVNPRYKN